MPVPSLNPQLSITTGKGQLGQGRDRTTEQSMEHYSSEYVEVEQGLCYIPEWFCPSMAVVDSMDLTSQAFSETPHSHLEVGLGLQHALQRLLFSSQYLKTASTVIPSCLVSRGAIFVDGLRRHHDAIVDAPSSTQAMILHILDDAAQVHWRLNS